MVQEQKKTQNSHSLILENRKSLNIMGVSDVDSFDDKTILVYTILGELTIKGADLHIAKIDLEKGEMRLEGSINSLVYTDNQSKNMSFFAKLFR